MDQLVDVGGRKSRLGRDARQQRLSPARPPLQRGRDECHASAGKARLAQRHSKRSMTLAATSMRWRLHRELLSSRPAGFNRWIGQVDAVILTAAQDGLAMSRGERSSSTVGGTEEFFDFFRQLSERESNPDELTRAISSQSRQPSKPEGPGPRLQLRERSGSSWVVPTGGVPSAAFRLRPGSPTIWRGEDRR